MEDSTYNFMDDPIYKLRVLFSWRFITWVLVILHIVISAFFYFKWVSNCAVFAEHNYNTVWYSLTLNMPDFYWNILLSLILITSRALDFTTTKSQNKFFYFMLIMVAINIWVGYTYVNYIKDASDILFITFPFTVLVSIALFFIGFFILIFKYDKAPNKKIALFQILLSLGTKFIIWIPLVYLSRSYNADGYFIFLCLFSFFCVAISIGLNILTHVYNKRNTNLDNQTLVANE